MNDKIQKALINRQERLESKKIFKTDDKISNALEKRQKRIISNLDTTLIALQKDINKEIQVYNNLQKLNFGYDTNIKALESTNSSRVQIGKLKNTVEAHRKYIGDDSADMLLSTLNEMSEGYNNYLSAAKQYSNFNSENDYNAYVMNNTAELEDGMSAEGIAARIKAYEKSTARLESIDNEIANMSDEEKWVKVPNPYSGSQMATHTVTEPSEKHQELLDEKAKIQEANTEYEHYDLKRDKTMLRAFNNEAYAKFDYEEYQKDAKRSRYETYEITGNSPDVLDRMDKFSISPYKSNTEPYKGGLNDPLTQYLAFKGGTQTPENFSDKDLHDDIMQKGAEGCWEYLNEEEKKYYYSLIAENNYWDALDFLEGMRNVLCRRAEIAAIENIKDWNGWDLAGANVVSIPANIIGGAIGFFEDAEAWSRGDEIDPYSLGHQLQTEAQIVRGETANRINDTLGDGEFLGVSWGDAYQAAMSGIDSVVGAATFGKGYTVIMGMGAASSKAKQLYEQGASNGQIAAASLLSGVAEMAFEKFSIGHFLDEFVNAPTKKWYKLLGQTALQGGIEMTEEMATELSNIFTDVMVLGSRSEWEKLITSYKEQGYSDWEAISSAMWDKGGDILEAGIMGFISGTGMGAGGSVINAFNTNKAYNEFYTQIGSDITSAENIKSLVAAAKTLDNSKSNAKVKALAAELEGVDVSKLNAKEKTAFEKKAGQLYEAVLKVQNKQGKASFDTAKKNIIREQLNKKGITDEKEIEAATQAIMKVVYNKGALTAKESELLEKVGGNEIASYLINNAAEVTTEGIVTALNNKAVINETKSLTKKQNTYAREINTDDYIYSGDGKTYIDGENTPVDISGIASIKNGSMTLELSDGRTAELGDVILGSETQAILYEGVLDMGVDAASAQAIVNLYDENAELGALKYVYGMRQAVEYGKIGAKAFLNTGAFTADLNAKQREMAYEIGRMTAENEAKREAERKQRASGNSEGRSSGGIRFDGITESELDETQKTIVNVFKHLFGGYGVTIEFFKSAVDERGAHTGENGSYDPNTNTIRLDINAGAQGKDTILFTAAHELTHFIKQWSPEKFRVFGEFLLNSYAKRGVSIDDLIKEQQAKAERNGRELDYEAAYEEVVADSCETFLRDSRLFDKLLNLKQQDKSLFEKTKEYISKLFDKVAALRHKYRSFNPDSKEGNLVTQMTDTIEQLHRLWEDAAMTALDNSRKAHLTTAKGGASPQGEATSGTTQKNTAENGGGIKLQAREYDANGNAYWRIESKKDIFNGLKTTAQYERAAREFLIKSRDNKTVIHAIDGKEMSFIRLSAEEFTNSEESKELKSNNPEMFNKKMRLIPSLEDLTLNANVNWQSPDLKNHKLFKERGFENFRGKLRIDNIIFNYIIRAGKAKFGDVFYDINLEVDQILPRTNNASGIKKSTSKSSIRNPDENVKQKQLEIIQQTNPMWDDYHTGIRTVADIHTWAEVLRLNDEREGQFVWGDFSRADAEQALKDGTITVYSSHPIKNGVFVSTSYIQAQEYAGGRNGKVYSKTIPLTDVAWINGDEGQYAEVGEAQKNTADGNSVVRFSERDYPIDADVAAIVNNSVSAKKDTSHILSTITAEQNKAINRLNNQSKNDLYRGKYTGGKHRFSDTMIKHALKEHGDFLREGLRAQLPITKKDIARHLSAIKDNKSPSTIKPTKTKRGTPSIVTSYEINGYTLYAEEITKSLGKNLPSDLIGHTMYKAPTLATAAALATSARAQPKRQSTVLCKYYIPKNGNLSTANFIADKNGKPALLSYATKNSNPKVDVLLGGLIALSSDENNFTDVSGDIEQGYVRCRKPFYITQDNKVFSNSETDVAAKLNELKAQGYDCFIFDYNIGDNYLVAVFNEAQIVKNTNGNVIPVSKKTDNTDDKTMRSDRDPAFVSEQGFRAENSLNNIEDEAVSKDNVAFSMPIGKRRRNIDKNVIELSKDNELSKKIGDLHGAVKYKVIQQYILDVIRGQKIVLSDGKVAVVDKSDAQHIARGAGDKKTTQISNIKKIIEKAVLVAEEDSTKERKFDYFYYYGADVKYDGEIFNIYLNVGRATNDKSYHLYDITQKLRDTAHRLNDVGRPPINKGCAVETVSLNDIIPKTANNVNNDYSTNTDNIEYDAISEQEQKYIQTICDKLGRAVVFEDLRDMYYKGEIISPDGYIENGVIHLNTYAENPIGFVFKHELTHFAEKASGYAEFVRGAKNSNVYKKWLCGKMGESDIKIAEYKYKQMVANTHSDIYSASDPKAEAEMIADFVGEMLFTDNGSGMASLVSDVEVKHRNKVVQFVLDLISYLKKKLSGMNFSTLELSILEDSFNRIVSEATELENKGLYKYDNDISFCFVACTDQERIKAAEELERQGYNRLYIFKNCGLIRDAYGKWKYELNTREFKFYPDGNARTDSHYFNYKLQKPDGSFKGRLCDFVLFNSLFELYPQLKDITVIIKNADDTVRFIINEKENGKEPVLFINKRLSDDFKSNRNNDIKSYILRELQRAIQYINGEYIGKSLTYWENMEKEGKTPYSEKLGRKLTAQEAHKYTADNYEAKIVETRRALRDTLRKTDANKGRNLSNINEVYLYSTSIERDMDILFDENDNPFISKEYLLPSKDNSISDNNEGTTAENEVVPSLPDGTEENDGNSFEVALKKNQNSNELRRFLSAARMIDKNDIAQNLNIRAGSDSLISNVADNAKQAAEYFNRDRINELSQKILQRIDSIGRTLSDSLLEKFKNTIFKNEKGQMTSLYTLKMRGVGGFEHSKLGLVAGTLEAAEQLYAQYNDGSPRNRDVYIQEIFVNMKNPLVLNYTPYEDSIRGIHDLVEREILFYSEFINLINQKNAAKEPTYSGLTTRKTREAIQNAGYDGIIYFNDSTDKGSMTVIVFDESQMITVAENGILQQNNGIMEDYFDLAAAEDAAKKVNNDKNIKLYTADSKYNKRKYRPVPDERIKAGNSGFMEKVTCGVGNAKRALEENLAGNNEITLSGKDVAGRTLGKNITGECDKTFFKDKNGNLLSFFAYGKKIIDLEKAIKSRTFFGTLNSAINDLVLSKEKSPRSIFGVIQEFYINSVAPLVVELDNLDVEAIAKQIFEEKIITEKEYYRIISPERKNPALVLINKLDEKGFDCIVFAKQTGECAVLPFDASQVFPVADNGIVKENSNVTQVDEIEEYNENYRIDRVVIEREGETPIDTQEIRNILTTEHDNTIKMKLVTKVLMCNNNPAIDYSDNRTAGHSGILEKNKVNTLNACAIVTALINRNFSDISIADTDMAGRFISEYKRQLLRESKFVDKDGRPLSVFGFNRYGHNRFKHSQFGLRVSTLNAAHDMSLFPKENPLANARGSFEEYYPIVKNPYFIMFDPENLTPAMLAKYLLEEGTITNKQYESVLVRLGADRAAYHSGASNYLTRILKEKGFDCLAFMNERADPGSIGLIVFDKSQLIPVAIDGLPVENSDRTLADSDNEPAFLIPEDESENFVEKGDENEIDSLGNYGYNEIIKKDGLNQSEKTKLKQKIGWSDEIIDYIRSMKEAQIYIDANLKEAKINGRKCLIRNNIDTEQINIDGTKNIYRIQHGKAPCTITGEKIELHHIGQMEDSPLAELTKFEHRGKGNDTILHDKKNQSKIERARFDREREEYWKSRDGVKGDSNE